MQITYNTTTHHFEVRDSQTLEVTHASSFLVALNNALWKHHLDTIPQ